MYVYEKESMRKKEVCSFASVQSEAKGDRQLATDIFAFISGGFVNSSQPDFFEVATVPADPFDAMYLLELTFVLWLQPVFISFQINSRLFKSRSFENKNHLIG